MPLQKRQYDTQHSSLPQNQTRSQIERLWCVYALQDVSLSGRAGQDSPYSAGPGGRGNAYGSNSPMPLTPLASPYGAPMSPAPTLNSPGGASSGHSRHNTSRSGMPKMDRLRSVTPTPSSPSSASAANAANAPREGSAAAASDSKKAVKANTAGSSGKPVRGATTTVKTLSSPLTASSKRGPLMEAAVAKDWQKVRVVDESAIDCGWWWS